MCSNRKRKVLAMAAALTTAVGLSTSAAADSAYEMIAYLESLSGSRLAAGDYAGAIDFATKRLHGGTAMSRLVEHTNLCVAYTVVRDFALARERCDTALELARHVDEDLSHGVSRTEQETAKAMTNRGVLKAMTGDVAGAASDFRRALAVTGPRNAAGSNLLRVESAMTDRLAMTEAR